MGWKGPGRLELIGNQPSTLSVAPRAGHLAFGNGVPSASCSGRQMDDKLGIVDVPNLFCMQWFALRTGCLLSWKLFIREISHIGAGRTTHVGFKVSPNRVRQNSSGT